MSDYDEIDESLRRQREAAEDPAMDEDLMEQITRSFHGNQRRFTLFAMMKLSGSLGLAIASGIAFFYAESVRGQILSATIFLLGMLGYGIWWLVYWLQLQRNAELRELKRLELQIALLDASLRSPPRIRAVRS